MAAMSSSVPFATISDPIKLFDGLDISYPPENLHAHFRSPVTFPLGPQPIDPHGTLSWHSRHVSLLQGSLTGTASSWYDRLPQFYKDVWSSVLEIFEKQFLQNKHTMHNLKFLLSLKKERFCSTLCSQN